ncbi:MAG: hypothetical protein HKN40_01110 [Winogradskyella sp.]|uniref:hypothetical protein n=1 Tax=Winogradskyella sp. TaxID=1883156 RepID=UPI0017F8F9FC|nr:hypothetical protein [Winogradskyella sp.]
MKNFLILFFSLCALNVYAQDVKRVTVNGKIIVSSQDKEGVTVYNTSSNKGTVTDVNGNFNIQVALNDIVEFGALQFKDFTVVISDKIIATRQMTVILVEEVNKLDEVVLLPFGLTGNLNEDLENVRTFNADLDAIYFGLDHVTDFEFSADYKTKPENVAFKAYNPSVENMVDIINVTGFLLSQVTRIDKSKNLKDKQLQFTPFKKAIEQYSINFIHYNFNIPLDKVDAFIDYVEAQGIDKELLKENREVELLERVNQLSKSFLKIQGVKG